MNAALADIPWEEWPQEEREEFRIQLRKNLKNKRWRLDNLYWIVNEKGEAVKFKMNLAQKILYLGLWFCNLILKSRQHGITTFSCIYGLDCALFNSNFHATIIVHNKEDAQDLFERNIKYAYDHLWDEVKLACPAVSDSARKLSFDNGSSIKVMNFGRSCMS